MASRPSLPPPSSASRGSRFTSGSSAVEVAHVGTYGGLDTSNVRPTAQALLVRKQVLAHESDPVRDVMRERVLAGEVQSLLADVGRGRLRRLRQQLGQRDGHAPGAGADLQDLRRRDLRGFDQALALEDQLLGLRSRDQRVARDRDVEPQEGLAARRCTREARAWPVPWATSGNDGPASRSTRPAPRSSAAPRPDAEGPPPSGTPRCRPRLRHPALEQGPPRRARALSATFIRPRRGEGGGGLHAQAPRLLAQGLEHVA